MEYIAQLITNPFLLTAVMAWALAQIAKTVIFCIMTKHWNPERLIGDGGMPSGHSATVSALATMTGLMCGFHSFEFAAAAVLAIIVCHDAMGVRRETGKQAVILNDILENYSEWIKEENAEIRLKEFVGHTPAQVSVGIALGILSAIIMFQFYR